MAAKVELKGFSFYDLKFRKSDHPLTPEKMARILAMRVASGREKGVIRKRDDPAQTAEIITQRELLAQAIVSPIVKIEKRHIEENELGDWIPKKYRSTISFISSVLSDVGISDTILYSTTISSLQKSKLSNRFINNRCHTLGDVLTRSRADLLILNKIGPKSITLLAKALIEFLPTIREGIEYWR